MKIITPEIKTTIEQNPVALATVMPNGKPNIIAVAGVLVEDTNTILISDCQMHQTIEDIKNNPNVAIEVWDKKETCGYKIIGIAKYYDKGVWVDKVIKLTEDTKYLAKGAIIVKVLKIIAAPS